MERGADAVSECRNVVVISVDHLRAAYLGCYGNTWIATPAIDRLATEQMVFDEAHATGPLLEDFFRAAWSSSLGDWIRETRSILITDDEEVGRLGVAADFEDHMPLPRGESPGPASDFEETHLAAVCGAAIETIEELDEESDFLWLHIGSLGQVWDAPRAMRERYYEEGDAPVPDFVAPPSLTLPKDFDPDERWGYALAYAAQVSVLDACLGVLFEHLRAARCWNNASVLFCGVRGFPLGEHRVVGANAAPLYGEILHVPWLWRRPGGGDGMTRHAGLAHPGDLPLLLTEDQLPDRDQLLFHGRDHVTAIRTREWFLRRGPSVDAHSEARVELYVKPDDRWEVNDVHDRCHDVVEELSGRLPDLKHGVHGVEEGES